MDPMEISFSIDKILSKNQIKRESSLQNTSIESHPIIHPLLGTFIFSPYNFSMNITSVYRGENPNQDQLSLASRFLCWRRFSEKG